jgi:hypothetical protein
MDGDMDLIGIYDPGHTGQPQSITVTNANVGNVDMVLTHMNHWTTARENLDTVQTLAADFGNDFQLMTIQSNSDSVGRDGKSRSWAYALYSPQRQHVLTVRMDGMRTEVDTSQNNPFPPNMLALPLDFINSDAIMTIAESHGGAEIRQQHDIREVRLTAGNLQWDFPQNPSLIFWDAEYSWQIADSVWNSWHLYMDIHTGEIVNPNAVKPIFAGGTAREFALLQNFPNPFNPTTTVPFLLPRAGYVELRIYDIQGREVTTLVNSDLPAGAQSVRFDAARLAGGIYFCRLQAENYIATQKMLLLK